MKTKRIKAIETEYKGIKFKSKLEAHWAVFFDECGIVWEYEPEGFELDDGVRYLPDFLLHNVVTDIYHPEPEDIYVEVKGLMERDDIKKIKKFVYGSNEEIKENLYKQIDFWLEVYGEDGLEIPKLPYVIQNKLLIVGKMPLKKDFENLNEWLNENYGEKNLTSIRKYGNRAIYSYRTITNEYALKDSKIIPLTNGKGELAIVPADWVKDLDEFLEPSIKAYYNAVNYRFDHKKLPKKKH